MSEVCVWFITASDNKRIRSFMQSFEALENIKVFPVNDERSNDC